MDRGMCNGCRSLSRISTVFAVVLVSLVLPSVSSVQLPEQSCKPRPVVVAETGGHKPYHVLVYRCSGTCDENIPPSQKPCTAAGKKEIAVEVTDPLGQDHKIIYIYNHTSCSCDCNLECNWAVGEQLHGDECKCLQPPTSVQRCGDREPVDVLPYKIGLASLGFFTALILVLIVCTKRKGVLEKVKQSCCKRRGQEPQAPVQI